MNAGARTLFLLLGILLFSSHLSHALDPSENEENYTTPIPRMEGQQIIIDGILDEEVWEEAQVFDGFYQYLPIDRRLEEDSTIVYAWYSPTAIYFGIKAYAPNGEVRATLADRDKIENDDYVYIVLDTYNDQRQAFIFGSNPLGQQSDGIMRDSQGSGFFSSSSSSFTQDLSPDFVYTSKGTLTDFGYVVEFEIPFKSLRYQSDLTQNWGFNVMRKVQHSGYLSTWTQVLQDNASFMSQNGLLQSLTDLRRGLVLDISPEITGGVARSDRDVPFDTNIRDPLGLNVRWGVSNNLTLNATVNPDFSQVEADVAQLQFDPRSAVFVPERRPFFLDGIELFQSPTQLIYSRRIANPLSAAKLTGKTGGTNVAFLSAVDNNQPYLSDLSPVYFNALRVRQDLKGQNTLGITYTDKIDDTHWNRVAAIDGRLVFSKIYSIIYQTGFSATGDPGSTSTAPMWQLSASASGRKYGASFSTSGFHGDFNAETGFIQRVGIARMTFSPRVTWFGEEGETIEKFTTGITLDGTWDYDRFTRGTGPNDRKLHGNTSYSFRGGWSGGTSMFYESFKYPEELYNKYFIEIQDNNGVPVDTVAYTGENRLTNLGFWSFLNTPQLNTFSANLLVIAGRDVNFFEWARAGIYFIDLSLNWNPTDKLRFNLLYNHQQYVRYKSKTTVGIRRVPRLKVEYQISPSIFLRLVGQYDSNFVDELRDNTRTEDPILILDSEDGTYKQTSASRNNSFRVDWLFSYRPTPGTVLFFGYGSSLREPQSFRFTDLRRQNDGFFVKFSYLFRV